MSTPLRNWSGLLLLVLAMTAAPALAQVIHTETGDAPDGVSSSQDAYGADQINGSAASTSDADCYGIFIDDPAGFSASTVGGATIDTKLYLFTGTDAAVTGLLSNDDEPGGTVLQSRIPAGSFSGSAGKYVLCVTTYDNDPVNAAGEDIWSGPPACAFDAVCTPNPPSGDANLAGWVPSLGAAGTYSVFLTGVGNNPGTCSLAFASQTTATVNGGGTSVTFAGSVTNAGPGSKTVRLNVQYARVGGPPSGTLSYGPATIPQGGPFPFNINQPIPAAAPSGTYNLTFQLIDNATGQVCATQTASIVLPAPRTSAAVAEATPPVKGAEQATALVWEATAAPLFASATTAVSEVVVSPNPFSQRTALTFSIDEASEVRLAVYDVLGREVATLVSGRMDAGSHTAVFEAGALASGTYVYRLVVNDRVETGRVTIAR